ncbi:MAG TPA: CPBP family intramembrane glutamic endopeptidase [Gemmatimonadaceae bacterium]|nr:CPBP family intramembrane glutamic endopeptidase [Gemmatimonadaceae bacterium]
MRRRRDRVRRQTQGLAAFLGWTYAMAVPLWIAGTRWKSLAVPGLPIVDTLMVLCPLLAASLLTWRRGTTDDLERLLMSAVDVRRVPSVAWYAPSLLIAPSASVLSYAWMRADRDAPCVGDIRPARVLLLFVAFLVGAASEEVGWTAYAAARLRRYVSLLTTGVVIGSAEAAWHVIQLVQIGRSSTWIGWWCLWTMSARVLMVHLYDETGSVFTAVLFHASMNLGWQLVPDARSHWDPRLNSWILAAIAGMVVAPAARAGVSLRRR